MSPPLPIAWLTTGRGPGSFGAFKYVLQAIDAGLPVEIAVLFLNREPGEAAPTDAFIAFARRHHIAVETLSSVAFRKAHGGRLSKPGEPPQPWRLEYDATVANALTQYRFDIGVMFGYMLIATAPLHTRYRFINDHPALPDGPVGTYQEVIRHLIVSGARESGCMANVVTSDVDRGPAISFCRFPIRDSANEGLWEVTSRDHVATLPVAELTASPLFSDIRERGVRRERPFLVETLRELAVGEIAVPPAAPVDLTSVVEGAIAPARGTTGDS